MHVRVTVISENEGCMKNMVLPIKNGYKRGEEEYIMKNKYNIAREKNITGKKGIRKCGAAGLILIALVLGACGQPDITTESIQSLGIPISETENSPGGGPGAEDSVVDNLSAPDLGESSSAYTPNAGNGGQAAGSQQDLPAGGGQNAGSQQDVPADGGLGDSSLLQPTYIGSWKVTDYCYPTTPCGLSQMEVDILVGSELIYAQESFTCNQKVIQSEVFGYEFWDCNNLTEYEQSYNVSVEKWFEEGNTGKVKCGYLTMEEDIFGNRFAWMEEQPDKMMIYYYGVIFLAVNDQAQAGPAAESPRDGAYLEALKNLLFYQQLPLDRRLKIYL